MILLGSLSKGGGGGGDDDVGMWECGIEYGFELLSGHWHLQNLEIFLSLFCILIGKLQFGD